MLRKKLAALWQFSRPHTIVGTTLSVAALYVMAGVSVGQLLDSGAVAITALITCLLANVYIVGLNQLTDVEIDRINKPQLPIARGDLSTAQGIFIIIFCLVLSLGSALYQGQFLFLTVIASLGIGTAYSLPPIRLKRFPFWAAVCIFGVRGIVVNWGLYLHFNLVLNGDITVPTSIWVLSMFILVFTYVIAIFKDMPDTDGDRQFNIATLSIKWGQLAVFNLSKTILMCLYITTTILGIGYGILGHFPSLILGICHGLLAIIFFLHSNRINLGDRKAITDFYQFIWRLFYLEYLIFPLSAINSLLN